mgnify:FL=1
MNHPVGALDDDSSSIWRLTSELRRREDPTEQQGLSPWKLNNLSSILFSSVLALPSKRWVFLGTAAVLGLGAALRKIQKSEPIQRALYFWKHAGPIIAHYKFTKWWLNVQKVHGVQRDAIFEELHDRYAQPALDIALHLTGLYVKLGQIL